MSLEEIVLPETKPETEWVRGRALQKMSPQQDHGRIQFKFAHLLDAWGRARGRVATEWRFRIAVPGEARRPLVPDIAFVANAVLRMLSRAEAQIPALAPTVAIEILSPGDDPLDVESKIDVYLRGGSSLVLVIDPRRRSITAHDLVRVTRFAGDDDFAHDAVPGFTVKLAAFFADALDSPIYRSES